MKYSILKKSSLLLVAITALISCEKESLENSVDQKTATESILKKENGMLVFKDYAEMEMINNKLNRLTNLELQEWESKNNFQSLASLERKINDAEVEHQEEFFKGLNPNLSVEQYEKMGYFYKHSELYKTYLNKGTIQEKIEKDGSIATELSIKNHLYLHVLNQDGKVMVGNEIVEFRDNDTFVYGKKSNELLRTTIGNHDQSLNNEFNFDKGTGSVGSRYITDPAKGSNYRYYAFVKFSSSYTVSTLSQTFYWEARAEQKKFGNWNTRNDYNPIWGCSANWSYDYWIIYPGAGFGVKRDGAQYPLPNSSNKPTSPYSVSNLNTNYTVRDLQFSSIYSINPATIGYSFFENVRVYNYNFTFKFSGGSSGYNYSYN